MSHFLKSEADRINRDTPWLLDSKEKEAEDKKATERFDRKSKSFQRSNTNSSTAGADKPKKSRRYDEMLKEIGPCPHCKNTHDFVGKGNYLCVSSSFRHCPAFLDLVKEAKAALIEKVAGCTLLSA